MYCPACGSRNPEGSRFCKDCGAALPVMDATPQPAQAGDAAHAPEPAPTPVPTPEPAPTPAPMPAPRRMPVAPIAIGAAAVIVAAAGFIAWSALFAPYEVSEKTFHDTAVASGVLAQLDLDHDGKLSRDEAKAATSLTVDGAQQVTGLGKYLPNLTSLTVKGATLPVIDLSDLPHLKSLDAPDAQGGSLDVSRNPELDHLGVGSDVNVTGLEATKLTEVWLPTQVKVVYAKGSSGGTVYQTTYNANGTIAKLDVRSGDTDEPLASKTYAYDDAGKLTKVSWEYREDGTKSGSSETDLSYDDAGRLVKASVNGRETAYSYDDAGRLVKKQGVGDATAYSYDAAGRCVQEASGNGTVTYAYDDAGRCTRATTVREGETTSDVAYGYDDAGNLTSVSDAALDLESFTYAYADGRLTRATATNDSGETADDFVLTYDDAGKLVKAEDSGRGTTYELTYTRAFAAKDGTAPQAGFSIKPAYTVMSTAWMSSAIDVVDPEIENPDPAPYRSDGVIDRLDMWR